MNKRGAVLLLTFIIMITLTVITAAFLYMTSTKLRGSAYDIQSAKALWVAEGGMQYVIYQIKYDSDFRDDVSDDEGAPTTGSDDLGDGSYAYEVYRGEEGEEDEYIFYITSTGTVGVMNRQIQESFEAIPAVINRAIHADGAHVKFNGSSGIVNGNVSCFVSVLPDPLPPGLTITGTVTDQDDGEPKTNPAIVWDTDESTYYALADALGQVVETNYTFNSTTPPYNGTYTGIWWVTKKVTIESNVTINGTIIAEGNIDFEKQCDNVTVNPKAYAPDQNYPALVSGGSITGKTQGGVGLQNSSISGLVLADNNIMFDNLSNTTFTGTILAGNNIEMENSALNDIDVTYDASIFSPQIPDFSYTGWAALTPQYDWTEVIPPS